MTAGFDVAAMSPDPEDVVRIERIVAAFERTRFRSLDLTWPGGVVRLHKGGMRAGVVTILVRAPRVGVFHPIDGIAIGRTAADGATMGHVDVLGSLHPVLALPDGGVVLDCLAADGQFVEWGAPLFRLAPFPKASN